MLYTFFGNDTVRVRGKASGFIENKEKKGAQIARMTPGDYMPGMLEDAAGSASLFGGEQVVVIDTPSEREEMFEKVFDMLDVFAESGTTFVLIEEKLAAPEKKKLQKYAAEAVEFQLEAKEAFNAFALSDALADRDKKKLWILLAEARTNGQSAEELIGLLFWQLKALRLAAKGKSAEETGLKPFVYSKAKRALAKFSETELDALGESLTELYHQGHGSTRNIDVALERWVLGL